MKPHPSVQCTVHNVNFTVHCLLYLYLGAAHSDEVAGQQDQDQEQDDQKPKMAPVSVHEKVFTTNAWIAHKRLKRYKFCSRCNLNI